MDRQRPFHTRAGFTLVEVLIAVGLGLGIIGTSFAAFRVASQAATVANRLSLENALMRAGYARAQEELDFWQGYDDAQDPGQEQLRSAQASGGRGANGLMFAPMAQVLPGAGGFTERALGWDAQGWRPDDPRCWYRGNMAEKVGSTLVFGRYAIFANASDGNEATDAPLRLYDDSMTPAPPTPPDYRPYAPTSVPHHWHDHQLRDIMTNAGFFMVGEYLPANTIYAYSQAYDTVGDWLRRTNLGGIPLVGIRPADTLYDTDNKPIGTDPYAFCNQDGNQQTARGKYRETYRTSWAAPCANMPLTVQSADPDFATLSFAERWRNHRRYYETGYGSTTGTMDEFVKLTTIATPLLDTAPAQWPRVRVSVNRFIGNARSVALFRLDLVNPLTGNVFELSFTGFGTTLRGARQQRYFDPTDNRAANDPLRKRGWARWDDRRDAGAPAPDPTLDSPGL